MTSLRKMFPDQRPAVRAQRRHGRRAADCWALRAEPTFLMVGAQRARHHVAVPGSAVAPEHPAPGHAQGRQLLRRRASTRAGTGTSGTSRSRQARKRKAASGPRLGGGLRGQRLLHVPPARARADRARRCRTIKIVAMVRDPVERAYSAYKHEFARGFETETFERALELEDSRVEPELARMLADPAYQSSTYRHQAYRRRGHYAEQLDGVQRPARAGAACMSSRASGSSPSPRRSTPGCWSSSSCRS